MSTGQDTPRDDGERVALRSMVIGLMRSAESKAAVFERLGFPEYARELRQDADMAQALLSGGDAAVLRLMRQREQAPEAEHVSAA